MSAFSVRFSQKESWAWLHYFHGFGIPTPILSCRPNSTICADFFLVNLCPYTNNCNGKVQIFLIRWWDGEMRLPCHLSSISARPVFRKRLEHHLFSSAFPGISSSSTGITVCEVTPSTNVTHQIHPANAFKLTISRDSHQNIRLHTGTCVNVVLLTYLHTEWHTEWPGKMWLWKIIIYDTLCLEFLKCTLIKEKRSYFLYQLIVL